MAVKKVKENTKNTEVLNEDVEVNENIVETTNAIENDVAENTEVEEVSKEVETVEVETPPTEEEKSGVDVDAEAIKVKDSNKPDSVKIRMRVDHKCTIAMERYDLVAGKTYTVPQNVKRILNNAGLLAPL